MAEVQQLKEQHSDRDSNRNHDPQNILPMLMISDGQYKVFFVFITFAFTFLAKWYPIDQIYRSVRLPYEECSYISELTAHIIEKYDQRRSTSKSYTTSITSSV
jgi:hypothetical protein